jgi:hypothetical protein
LTSAPSHLKEPVPARDPLATARSTQPASVLRGMLDKRLKMLDFFTQSKSASPPSAFLLILI